MISAVALFALLVAHPAMGSVSAPANAVLFDSFSDELMDDSQWAVSDDDQYSDGEWDLGTGSQERKLDGEQSLVLKLDAKHHAISAPIKTPFDISSNGMTVHYEVRFNKKHECGGAYMKLPSDGEDFSTKRFNGDTPYSVMFGPDKCGSTNKVHFIFRHKNPVTGEVIEHHLKSPPSVKLDEVTHSYTLSVSNDNRYQILIDGESAAKGSLLEDFEPAVNPAKIIDDPEDSKPEDWVDEERIEDPAASKPDDWDEDAPYMIPDESATMPEGWLVDGPEEIPDPEAEMPEDWSVEDDGEWEPPLITNPVCEEIGCGEWTADEIENPAYKGPWNAPMIDNPEYKGEWKAKKIENKAYFETKSPLAGVAPVAAVGFELWTMQGEMEFDNVYISASSAEGIKGAKQLNSESLSKKSEAEIDPEDPSSESEDDSDSTSTSKKTAMEKAADVFNVENIMSAAKENPVQACITFVVGMTTLIFLVLSVVSPAQEAGKEEAKPEVESENEVEAKKEEVEEESSKEA